MPLRMTATASAWASVFSPESSVSPAISGSAKARADQSIHLLRQRVRGGSNQLRNGVWLGEAIAEAERLVFIQPLHLLLPARSL